MGEERGMARKLFGDAQVDAANDFCARVDAEAARRREPLEERYRRAVREVAAEVERLNARGLGRPAAERTGEIVSSHQWSGSWDANGAPV